MASSHRPLWTPGRKLASNLLPTAAMLPVGVALAAAWPREGLSPKVLLLAAAFPAVGWAAVGLLGLAGNGGLRREMERRLDRTIPGCRDPRMFVGFAGPGYRSALDPHEEVGWLLVRPDGLELFGDASRVWLRRDEVAAVGLAPNAHTWLGLGGWVAVEGESGGNPVKLLVEPRERATHFGNLALRKALAAQLAHWARTGELPEILQPAPGGRLGP